MTRALGVVALAVLALAGCGGSSGGNSGGATKTVTVDRVITERSGSGLASSTVEHPGFDPASVYRRISPGVVTVISIFPGGGLGDLLGGGGGSGQEAVGSGFVIDGKGELATNAHVVTDGQGSRLRHASQVYVQFADGNQVPAKIVGADPNVDVALLKIKPNGLHLRPLQLGSLSGLQVGDAVAAIGSPFNEPQSLSVGVVSGLNRDINSLAGSFKISGAIQTDAAINHGNSGGPLVDSDGRVLGINSQIESTGGGGEGVGFAVPVDAVRRSLDQLRSTGKATYAFLGVSTVPIYPQLAEHFSLPTKTGAWVQDVTSGSPAARAGLKAGTDSARFQGVDYKRGGDIVLAVDGRPLRRQSDLSVLIGRHAPGDRVTLSVAAAGGGTRKVKVTLAARPGSSGG